ncbi:MAG TPA: tripartite tricarboxylate transporter substrate binding protein [Geminicoccaceae bacterium]|nr:tripartite tricarboxylate transporter substrate binding protein [Geminicoccus sp.]HMU51362.1 tripartite tricarboxylate transporter substrate binding protein [Geminicoccaceae bacterium]
MTRRLLCRLGLACLVAALAWVDPVRAAWPEKPVRLIVPFAPGGTSDQIARVFQRTLDENGLLGQPFTVVNVGGHWSVGARQVKDGPADGYTFLLVHPAIMGGEASGAVDFGYRDFDPVAATSESCTLAVVADNSPFRTLDDLMNAAKEKPDTIVFGVNIGGNNHLAALLLQQAAPGAAFRFTQVGGGADTFKNLAGGHTQAGILGRPEYASFKDSGIRALAYMAEERHPKLADIPTARELGYDAQFCPSQWWLAPKGTPAEAVAGLADVLERAIATPMAQQEMENRLFEPLFLKGDAFAASLDAAWTRIEPIGKLAAPRK